MNNETRAEHSPLSVDHPNVLEFRRADVSRRRFLQGAAIAGASAVVPISSAGEGHASEIPHSRAQSATQAESASHGVPIVPDFEGSYGKAKVPDFEAPRRPMGKTGLEVSILGVGGYHLGTVSGQQEVNNMVAMALDHGINFFDNAWEYHEGMSEERVGTALKGKRDKAIVMTKVCTHGRKKDLAMQMLEESLTAAADRSPGCLAGARGDLLQRSRVSIC